MSSPAVKRVVVVGGGISGLAAAHRLAELERQSPRGVKVTLLEASERLGGVIETRRQDGFLLENGPDAFLTEKPWAVELCRRIGLESELIQTRPEYRRLFVLQGGQMAQFEECGDELRRELSRRFYGMDAGSPRYDRFMSLKEGLGSLVERLAARMPEAEIRRSSPVRRIEPFGMEWKVTLKDNSAISCQALCLALPAPAAAALIEPLAPPAAQKLKRVQYAPVATVHLGFSAAGLPDLPKGFGYVVPGREVQTVLGCTFSSWKFPGRSPEGSFLLRAFVGGPFRPEAVELEEKEMAGKVREEISRHVGITAEPVLVSVRRYRNAVPLPAPEGAATSKALDEISRLPGLCLAGSGAVGIPDCVHQGEQAAGRLFEHV